MITYHLRIIRSTLRIVANSLRYLRIVTYYFRMIYGKSNQWAIVRIFLTCQNNCLCFHGSSWMSPSCDELYADLRVIYGCLRLTCDSVRNRKKNPCMWTRYKSQCDKLIKVFYRYGHKLQRVCLNAFPLKKYDVFLEETWNVNPNLPESW